MEGSKRRRLLRAERRPHNSRGAERRWSFASYTEVAKEVPAGRGEGREDRARARPVMASSRERCGRGSSSRRARAPCGCRRAGRRRTRIGGGLGRCLRAEAECEVACARVQTAGEHKVREQPRRGLRWHEDRGAGREFEARGARARRKPTAHPGRSADARWSGRAVRNVGRIGADTCKRRESAEGGVKLSAVHSGKSTRSNQEKFNRSW